VWDGSLSQNIAFQGITGIQFPQCLNASATSIHYSTPRDYSLVVDQEGIIQYKSPGVNVSAISAKIEELLAVTDGDIPADPKSTVLYQNYPNPFNPSTRIDFNLATAGPVRIRIYDTAGRLIRTLLDSSREAGSHHVDWNGTDSTGGQATSGIYFYVLDTAAGSESRKMILLK
jgi:hypothetical protein